MLKNKPLLLFIILFALLIVTVGISLFSGSGDLSVRTTAAALLHPDSAGTAGTIIWNIRIPRLLLGMLVGMGLAAGVVIFQGLLRNPLADPYTLGISGGAALGAALSIVTGLASHSFIFMPLCAFLGTLFSISAVYTAAARRSFSNTALILSGVILGFLFASLVLLVYSISSPSKVYSTMLWLMGDLAGTDTHLLQIAASLIPAGTVVLLLFSGNLDLLALGEEKAFLLGMNTSLTRKTLFVVASLITGTCVAVSGVIGFIGLMIPHLLRRVTGPGHRVLLPASALGGAIFLPLCDTIARTVIAPVELPVGVITGIIGALFFLIVFAQKTAEC